jgi:hypothetical protein
MSNAFMSMESLESQGFSHRPDMFLLLCGHRRDILLDTVTILPIRERNASPPSDLRRSRRFATVERATKRTTFPVGLVVLLRLILGRRRRAFLFHFLGGVAVIFLPHGSIENTLSEFFGQDTVTNQSIVDRP